MLACEAALEH